MITMEDYPENGIYLPEHFMNSSFLSKKSSGEIRIQRNGITNSEFRKNVKNENEKIGNEKYEKPKISKMPLKSVNGGYLNNSRK